MKEEVAPKKPKVDWGPYGRHPVVLLALVAFIDSVDRGIFNGVIPLVKRDLGFSDLAIGALGSVFILMGFVATIPAGYVADRLRRTRVIAIVLASWGAISALNATVRNYWQFLTVRAALGIGETVDNPASASLMADYYPPRVRGRAYAYQRVAPTVGTAIGIALGGAVGGALGWRAAFLVVGVPGSLLALWVWRMGEPRRGQSDGREGDLLETAGRRGLKPLIGDIKMAASVRSLRALMVGTAISAGATNGFAFWASAFYERHTALTVSGSGGVVGLIILTGAIGGTIAGGRFADRARATNVGAPMQLAGFTQAIASVIFAVTFLPVPLPVRLGGQVVAVAFLVAAFPALTAMTSEVVPSSIRGTAFSVTGFLSALVSAGSPLLVGAIADRFPITVEGETVGSLAIAFLCVTPLIFLGALVVLNGRRHVEGDIANVGDLESQLREKER